jgi:acetoin utilization deacetylase AcuC-like enzyme
MDELCIFYPVGHEAHFEAGHPERPERIESIRKALLKDGLWQPSRQIQAEDLPLWLLESVHSPAYLSLLERACRRGGHLDGDTYVTPASWGLALQSAAGAVEVATLVWKQEALRGLALCRPPGHHASRGQGMGFCLVNNIACAAQSLIARDGAKRVAIVDLDLHHGNGTQDIFWERGDVFLFSTHQMPLYPGTGFVEECGYGEGDGATANFPMPPGSGDEAFHAVMDQAILPLLDRFKPEVLLVNYGFDTHWKDPLGHLLLTVNGYAGLVDKLRQFAESYCQGRIAIFLEGGYDMDAAAACTLGVCNALLGRPWTDSLGKPPYRESNAWKDILRYARSVWKL